MPKIIPQPVPLHQQRLTEAIGSDDKAEQESLTSILSPWEEGQA